MSHNHSPTSDSLAPPSPSPNQSRAATSLTLDSSPLSQRAPTPAFSRPPSSSPGPSSDTRYPLLPSSSHTTPSSRRSLAQHAPVTPPRQLASRQRSPPTTLTRARNIALPYSPPGETSPYTPPPCSFARDLEGSVELTPLSRQQHRQPSSQGQEHDSPFHDRHSVLDAAGPEPQDMVVRLSRTAVDEDPFEFSEVAANDARPRRQKTMKGYQFASVSPPGRDDQGREMTFEKQQALVGGSDYWAEKDRTSYPPRTNIPAITLQQHPDLLPSPLPDPSSPSSPPAFVIGQVDQRRPPPIRPAFRLLFSHIPTRELLFTLLPACIFAIVASLTIPFMSYTIGNAFQVFLTYPLDPHSASSEQRAALESGIRDTCVKLAAAGAVAAAGNYMRVVMFQKFGEGVAARLRERVYRGVEAKGMEWFDLGMGMNEERGEGGEAVGAGGLMAKFTRETDDVRIATSLAFGQTIQNMSTFLSCFILAMVRSPLLALVTLSTIPIVTLIQIITQIIVSPFYAHERRAFAEASTNVERAISAISTVKAHNAQSKEVDRFARLVDRGKAALERQAVVWATNTALTDFFLLGTFVVGFWYGAYMVRTGKADSATVMTVFWACLLGASFLQNMVPQLSAMTKGKMSMASLLTVIQDTPSTSSRDSFFVISSPFSPSTTPRSSVLPAANVRSGSKDRRSAVTPLKGILPARCHGEFNLRNVSFAYPSRPRDAVLRDVSLFLPPGETTFIVGGSGSGKSTIAQLLLRLYTPSTGEITMDDQSFAFLDPSFTRQHIAAVQQGCILFDMSVHDNVAMGAAGSGRRNPEAVTREEVQEACRMAGISDFVEGLPQGYETVLGIGGSSLSGGQRQRLAIARARIREPTVLILDEATSALDATSRVTVFENLKAWRRNKTTIVITHDLSQILPSDFVYVMEHGLVAEQGFRSDLIRKPRDVGVFARMAAEQAIEPFPIKMQEWEDTHVEEMLDAEDSSDIGAAGQPRRLSSMLGEGMRAHTPSFGGGLRPGSMAYLDILESYASGDRFSRLDPDHNRGKETDRRSTKRLSTAQKRLSWAPEDLDGRRVASRASLGGISIHGRRPHSRMSYEGSLLAPSSSSSLRQAGSFDTPRRTSTLQAPSPEKAAAIRYRASRTLSENLEDDLKGHSASPIPTSPLPAASPPAKMMGVLRLIAHFSPTLSTPHKYLLLVGVVGAIGHGASTPIWANYLSQLMTLSGTGQGGWPLTRLALIVLGLCAAQAISDFIQEYCLYTVAARWTATLRRSTYTTVLAQDRRFFDESVNAPARLVQILIKDADDMRALMGIVIGKFTVFVVMVGLGITWALAVEWRMTLIGVALGPVFAGVMVLNQTLVGRAEVINKAKREAIARTFYESVANVRGIRAMALEDTFRTRFEREAAEARKTGERAAWYVGIGIGFSSGMPMFGQALMNYAGMFLLLQGVLTYPKLLQVFNLVLFSLTFGTAMLDFIPTLSKTKVAARDFNRLHTLALATAESAGTLRFPITGQVTFRHVSFSYPTRPDVPILHDLDLTLRPGECVAIVGPSGCGKSTIAALLQRLYEPTAGTITMDRFDLSSADTLWLRNHIAVVSQSANLFDASVAENIAYGSDVPLSEIHRAAKAANIHDFIMGLPQGYDTNLGENASLISGGQAQRLQIARALVRRSNILILDECTSALDVENQRIVLDTIVKIKDTRTTVFITHSVEAMRRCDRIVCLGEGKVAEEGTFEELVARGGVFAQLMKTGEWE